MTTENGTAPVPTVQQALAAVVSAMPAIGKTEENREQGYKFRGIESMTAAAGPLLGKHGVVIVPQVRERIYEERTTRNNRPMYVVHLRVRFRIYGPAGDYVTAEAWGEGTDMGDKATNKAMTGAFKYMLGQLLVIGDSASDADHTTPPEARGKGETAGEWWAVNWGEDGEAAHNEQRDALVAQLKAMSPEQQQAFKEWRTAPERDYSLHGAASTPDEMAAMAAKVDELRAQGEAPRQPEPPAEPEAPAPATEPAQPPTEPAVVPDAEPQPADPDEVIALVKALSKPDVVAQLRDLQLPTSGNEDTLRRRLVEALLAQPALAPAEQHQEDVPTGGRV